MAASLWDRGIALQRCDEFVGRTTNWLYDHLRFVPRYSSVVLCNWLLNRDEFPELKAWSLKEESLTRRIWRRIAGNRLFPVESWRLRQLGPHVLHSHFGYVAVDDRALHQVLGIPWIVSFYGADVYQLGQLAEWQDAYGRMFGEVARILALGPVMAAHIEYLGCQREKIYIHPLGVNVAGLPNKPRELKPGEPLKLLFAGTFREKKGIRYVIEAAALVRQSGVRVELHLVGGEKGKPGDRETMDEAFQLIKSLNLEDNVIHYGFLAFAQLLSLALRSHIFLAPSVTAENGDAEGTPFVLQQMMATGMPAIATMHADIPYLFGDHAHLLVPERDARAIAERIRRYVDEPGTLVTQGAILRDQMCRHFDVQKCAARLSDIYDVVLGLPSNSP